MKYAVQTYSPPHAHYSDLLHRKSVSTFNVEPVLKGTHDTHCIKLRMLKPVKLKTHQIKY